MARVLVVDDDDVVREMLGEVLVSEGYDVLKARDGAEALKVCADQDPDLIVVDMLMPEKDGFEVIREFKSEHPTTKIIAISGGGRIRPAEYLDMAEKFGADGTFTKPIDTAQLLLKVKQLIGP